MTIRFNVPILREPSIRRAFEDLIQQLLRLQDEHEAALAVRDAQILALQTSVSALQASMAQAETDIGALDTRLTTAESDIDTLESGKQDQAAVLDDIATLGQPTDGIGDLYLLWNDTTNLLEWGT